MISAVKSPRPPFSKGGRPLWLAISSSFLLLQRGMEACPPLVGGFSCVGATNIQIMSVYESIKIDVLVMSQGTMINVKRQITNAVGAARGLHWEKLCLARG